MGKRTRGSGFPPAARAQMAVRTSSPEVGPLLERPTPSPASAVRFSARVHWAAAQAKTTVLVVEDDASIRRALLGALEGAGFPVRAVSSGEEGLAELGRKGTTYGLLVLDLGLPGIDGFEVLEAVRADPGISHLPVIIVTRQDLDAVQRQQLAERTAAVLSKADEVGLPVVEAVSRLLRSSGVGSPPTAVELGCVRRSARRL